MDNTTWVVVADACAAKIFSTIKARLFNDKSDGHDLTLVSEHNHPESHKKDQDLVSDKQGSYYMGSFQEQTDPKQHEEDLFALELTRILTHAHNSNHYHDIILIAPPAFMGKINKHLPASVKKLVCKAIEKDYTHINQKELVSHLKEYL